VEPIIILDIRIGTGDYGEGRARAIERCGFSSSLIFIFSTGKPFMTRAGMTLVKLFSPNY